MSASGGGATQLIDPYLCWNTGTQVCAPFLPQVDPQNNITMTSTTPILVGGPGAVIPAGVSAASVAFKTNAASTNLTNCFAFLAVPDEAGAATATVVATSEDCLTATWAINTERIFSFAAPNNGGNAGSGIWTPTVDTPVYIGLVQNGSGLAQIRGKTYSASPANSLTLKPLWVAVATTGVTTPASLPSTLNVTLGILAPVCRVLNTITGS